MTMRSLNQAISVPSDAPAIPKELIKWLQSDYPPRCYTGEETVENHLKYAGKVELIATLAALAAQQEEEDPISVHAREQMALLDLEDQEHVHTAFSAHQLEG